MIHPSGGVGNYRFTPMEVSWESPSVATWSPDGKAFAYVAGGPGDRHVFVRYLNAPTPVMLTAERRIGTPLAGPPTANEFMRAE